MKCIECKKELTDNDFLEDKVCMSCAKKVNELITGKSYSNAKLCVTCGTIHTGDFPNCKVCSLKVFKELNERDTDHRTNMLKQGYKQCDACDQFSKPYEMVELPDEDICKSCYNEGKQEVFEVVEGADLIEEGFKQDSMLNETYNFGMFEIYNIDNILHIETFEGFDVNNAGELYNLIWLFTSLKAKGKIKRILVDLLD